MRERPPEELVELLMGLRLASARDLRRVTGRVKRLARDLPRFSSVWVDALQQAGTLTPYQARQINAGCGGQLQVGPYIITHVLENFGYGCGYRALHAETRQAVRLSVIPFTTQIQPQTLAQQLTQRQQTLAQPTSLKEPWGLEVDRFWVAEPASHARTADEWAVHHGRMTPEMVWEIARQMTATLAAWQSVGVVHGDLSMQRIWLASDGQIKLADPGLRALVRPAEGYAYRDLPPFCFDTLAPERVTQGTPPTVASDLYACGCLWWRLLTGRPPLGGGNSLIKLRAAQRARIPNLHRLVPEIPPVLAETIAACLQPSPQHRPVSFDEISQQLGHSTPETRERLAAGLTQGGPVHYPRPVWKTAPVVARRRTANRLLPVAIGCFLLAVASRPWWPTATDSLTGGSASAAPVPTETVSVAIVPPTPVLNTYQVNNITSTPVVENTTPTVPPVVSATRGDWQLSAEGHLVLQAKQPIASHRLPLQAGQTVRGSGKQRPKVVVSGAGLVVEVENVTFENIDFTAADEETTALVHLAAWQTKFVGCTFQGKDHNTPAPLAIRWSGPAPTSAAALPTGQLTLRNCWFRHLQEGVFWEQTGAVSCLWENCLFVGQGPMLRLAEWPEVDAPVALSLQQFTMRGGAPLLKCPLEPMPKTAGKLRIHTVDCALSAPGQGLIVLDGPQNPSPLLSRLEWTGEGNIVALDTPILVWHESAEKLHPAAEDQLPISGLMRSELQFTGDQLSTPTDSQVTRWQAPRRSTSPPGADTWKLPPVAP